ncbi:sugar phosphate nucleotidyltransferase [Thauera sp.]|jgi:glucose-1-phosphate thymidylyltransferase|uniref:sugar phosphate nucleotidyltransferase n=1 Tax=Thauera sp. TaxID=1905334 RepID=UPI002A36C24E|nr:sugar phosphate nucleotidyltransferase [Thauera sp.]MDX9885997.1 hypothetical protein [Thauera sp.]
MIGIRIPGSRIRLDPISLGIANLLLPIRAKSMIYYPLSVLMLASICDAQEIPTPQNRPNYRNLPSEGPMAFGCDGHAF